MESHTSAEHYFNKSTDRKLCKRRDMNTELLKNVFYQCLFPK